MGEEQSRAALLRKDLSLALDDFAPDELAYLGLTSKIERQVQDRLAWRLHQRLHPQGLLVAREFNRADIATLDRGGTVVVLVELKALYSFDVLGPSLRQKCLHGIASDLSKSRDKSPGAHAYALAVATHVTGSVLADLWPVVKYAGQMNRALNKHGDGDAVRMQVALSGLGGSTVTELSGPTSVAGGVG